MCRIGFKLMETKPYQFQDTGKCFSLNRASDVGLNAVMLGEICVHPTLYFNTSKEDLRDFILGKLNKNRCFRFEYQPQHEDQLRICISIERSLDFHFKYLLGQWVNCETPKISSTYFQLVDSVEHTTTHMQEAS